MTPSEPVRQGPERTARTTDPSSVARPPAFGEKAGPLGSGFNSSEGLRRRNPKSVLRSATALTTCGEKFRGHVPWRRT